MTAGKNRGQVPISASAALRRGNRYLSPIFKQKGFTYLALLLVVAAAGALLAATGEIASHSAQREKEADLLFAGSQFRAAIRSYYERSPGAKRYPQKLEDLLKDSRVPATLRHLRRIYRDPITGSDQWGVVEAPEGGIMGVYSLSAEPPVKSGGFSRPDQEFTGSQKYSDWKFTYAPVAPAAAPPAAASSPNGLAASR